MLKGVGHAVTHGHVDHVGALGPLLELYPDLRVVIHEAEADYISGPKQYFASETESWQHKALRLLKVSPWAEFKVSLYAVGVPVFPVIFCREIFLCLFLAMQLLHACDASCLHFEPALQELLPASLCTELQT